MGFFSKKKRLDGGSGLNSPSSSTSTLVPHPSPYPRSPNLAVFEPAPSLRLRVAVDPSPLDPEDPSSELFHIDVHPDDPISAIRRAVTLHLGDETPLSIFKVSIPWQAHCQARIYIDRYRTPLDLITSFPSFCLDDPSQRIASHGPADWQANQATPPPQVRIRDWWPNPDNVPTEVISVLVRPAQTVPSGITPLTLLAHFAPPDSARGSRATDSPVQKTKRAPPVVVDISPGLTVDELKAVLLRADGRQAAYLDKVVLWRVEMSEEELIVIEERGGLKGGRMPWPYPPCAPEPIALEKGSLRVSHYFPDCLSQGRMVNLTVWIHPSADIPLARMTTPEADLAPPFKYPMTFSPSPEAERRISAAHSLPCESPTAEHIPELRTVKPRGGRARPSTAPAAVVSPTGTPTAPPSFGSRPMSSLRPRQSGTAKPTSPLRAAPLTPLEPPAQTVKGLGLGLHGAIEPIDDAPTDLSRVPSLDFSNLSLTVDIVASTPRLEEDAVQVQRRAQEWGPAGSDRGLRPTLSLKSKSLGNMWRRERPGQVMA